MIQPDLWDTRFDRGIPLRVVCLSIVASSSTMLAVDTAADPTTHFADATKTAVQSVEYLDLDPTHPPALMGVDWGGRFLGGGFDTGCRWSGSTLAGEPADHAAGLCPGSQLVPRRFATVELRFDGSQRAYRYLRRDVPNPDGTAGPAPVNGRGYLYVDYPEVPVTVWKLVGKEEIQLQAMFTERQTTDLAGQALPDQPASQDASWMPTAAPDGGYELLSILDVKYSEEPSPLFEADSLFFAGSSPVLYGGWLRRPTTADQVDPADKLRIEWLDLGDHQSHRHSIAPAWIDVDNDQDLDLFTGNDGKPNQLFLNLGEGSFRHLLGSAINEARRIGSCSWVDTDNDGDLDLYVTDAVTPSPARLYRNDGECRFNDVATGVMQEPGLVNDTAWADYDLDGDLDAFLASGIGPNRLLRNEGGNLFVDSTPAALADNPRFQQRGYVLHSSTPYILWSRFLAGPRTPWTILA